MAYPTDYREPWIDDNGFVRAQTGSDRRTREAVQHTINVAAALTADGPRQAIIDARAMTSAEPGAWVLFVGQLSSITTALAVLVSDETTPTMIRFRELINSLLVPSGSFTDEESAIGWLKSLEI